MKIMFFGITRELAGGASLETQERPRTVGELRGWLMRQYPAMQQLSKVMIAVNKTYANDAQPLAENDEVAVIPPLSGGLKNCSMKSLIKIVSQIQTDEAIRFVESPESGGIVSFIGTVRNQTKGKPVLKLFFESYEPMALLEMEKIAQQAIGRWDVQRIAIIHAIGEKLPGEEVVVIAVAAPHRGAAFAACQFAIDTLKETVPIWKQEFFEDGAVWVAAHP